MKTLRTVARAARGAHARPPRWADDRPRPDDGRAARGPPLADRARARAVRRVVVSLFVNPAQFNERTDLERYPREEARDARLAARAGADLLFAPSVEEVYPPGFATSVEVLGVTERLEGAARGAGHFRGVSTVVTKLLCMALPDAAYFGQKDAQQVVVIRRLVRDLNLPVRIEVVPDRARARRPGHVQPQRPARPGRARAGARAARGAARGLRAGRRRRAFGRGALPGGGRRDGPVRRRLPSTWRSSTPTRSSRSTGSTGRRCSRSPRASARSA